jgi:hypothetical protein
VWYVSFHGIKKLFFEYFLEIVRCSCFTLYLIFTNSPSRVNKVETMPPIGNADHDIVYGECSLTLKRVWYVSFHGIKKLFFEYFLEIVRCSCFILWCYHTVRYPINGASNTYTRVNGLALKYQCYLHENKIMEFLELQCTINENPDGTIRPVVSVSALTLLIRYIYYWILQFLNTVIINKTKI